MKRLAHIVSLLALAAFVIGCETTDAWHPAIYDTQADGEKQLAEALRQAKAENKRVLLNLGANWCDDSQAMFRVLSTNREIQQFISDRFVFEMIDVNKRGGGERNAELVARLGNPIANGIPVILILDASGTVLNADPDERLKDTDHAFPPLVLAYLRKWALVPATNNSRR